MSAPVTNSTTAAAALSGNRAKARSAAEAMTSRYAGSLTAAGTWREAPRRLRPCPVRHLVVLGRSPGGPPDRTAAPPVISVDTKKKELVGEFKNGGTEWHPTGEPTRVKTHDFVDKELGRAVPYGVYDLSNDEGWVSVGNRADTAEFAVETIRRWWHEMGRARFPLATRLLITADAGGSNGYRVRAWKRELARLAEETGLEITVCHYPPGTSKWNQIEHRMFSFISMNWRGRPLESYRTIVELIAATTTSKGLRIRAERDEGYYETGTKVSDVELAALPLTRHEFHGDWNYTLSPSVAHSNVR